MKVTFDELRKSLDLVLRQLEEQGHEAFELDAGYYWNILDDERYEIYEKPTNLSMGDLEHDIERLREILEGEHYPLKLSFVWLGALLRSIGERGNEA